MSIMPSFFRSCSRSSSNNSNNVFDPFSLEIWDPIMFQDFPFPNSSLSNNMQYSSLPGFSLNESSSSSSTSSNTARFAKTRADWRETPEAHVFKVDLPGVKKDEVKVHVEEERVLQISGERNREKEEKNDKWHHVERSSGKFMRRFRLPETAKVDQVKATMENGVLTVTIPKQSALNYKPDVRVIEISG